MSVPSSLAPRAAQVVSPASDFKNAVADRCRVAALYREHGGALHVRCRRLLGDAVAAEDILQEVFCRVQRHVAHVPDGREALAWLSRVATNLCLNHLRDNRRQAGPVPLDEECESDLYPTAADVANRVHMRWVMSRVPEKLRAPAWLRHVEGMEQQEIAEFLGVSRRTIVYRLAAFRRAVHQHHAGSPGAPTDTETEGA